jgi:hypothetical protein
MSTMLHVLAATLARETAREELICRGVIRLSVADESDPALRSDLERLAAHLKAMTYAEWLLILSCAPLRDRLTSLGVQRPAEVLARLQQTLLEKQSLLTLTAR